jgi:hypothetical protein
MLLGDAECKGSFVVCSLLNNWGLNPWLRLYVYSCALVTALAVTLAGVLLWWSAARSLAADESLLRGRVGTSNKQTVSGSPIRAHRDDTDITVSVYTLTAGL